ncbi:hypothetical protein M8J77_000363 [Diaphorina citri]|nr:hypothetical protein M8J77_000363 [Diaphorina citri]
MNRQNIPKKLINLIKACMTTAQCKVRVNGQLSDTFEVRTGLKQGDCLSPILFNIILERAIRRVTTMNTGIEIGRKVNILAYADDIILISDSKEGIKSLVRSLTEETTPVGLVINVEKTKYMHFTRGANLQPGMLEIDGKKYEKVHNFKYLGANIDSKNRTEEEIYARIKSGNRTKFALKKMLSSKLLSHTSKLRIYKTLILPVVLYGAETWTLTKKLENKLKVFENSVLRQIYGPINENGEWRRRRNRELRALYDNPDIVTTIKTRRLQWYGHVMRGSNELARDVLIGEVQGRRLPGRPRIRWIDSVNEVMQSTGLREADWEDRTIWRRKLVEAMDQLRSEMPRQ